MVIKKLILKGYKRFFLNHIDYLEYTPDKPIQIILGTNGSGKTQLLKQLNPLPANLKQDFYDNGYKYIEITHNNNHYTISSGYPNSVTHSFIHNGIELNPSGGKKTHLELIKEHFNLTPDTIDILLNINRFTTMSPTERKRWLTEVSKYDYTYSITIYNNLKSKLRDITGVIRTLTETIETNESKHKVDKDYINLLTTNKEYLTKYYNHINSLHTKVDNIDTNTITTNISTTIKGIETILEKLTTSYTKKDLIVKKDKDIIELNVVKSKIDIVIKQLEELEQIPTIEDITTIRNKHKLLKDKIDNYDNNKVIDIPYGSIENWYNLYSSIHSNIVSCLNELTDYDEVRLLPIEEKNKIVSNLESITSTYSIKVKKLSLVEEELKHIANHKTEEHKMVCPKCSYNWYNGYNEDRYNILLKEKDNLTTTIRTIKLQLDKYTKLHTLLKGLEEVKIRLREILHSVPELTLLFQHVLKKVNINTSSVIELVTEFDKVNLYLDSIKDITSIHKEYTDYSNKLNNYESLIKANKEYNKTKLNKLKEELEILTKKKTELTTSIDNSSYNLTLLDKLEIGYNRLIELLRQNRLCYKNNIIKERNKFYTDLSIYLAEEIKKIDTELSSLLDIEKKMEEDKKSLLLYRKKESVLKHMVKELSPSEGLIAKSINQFLGKYIQDMNKIINQIWEYDVTIIPSMVTEGDDLDYKFKVRISNTEVVEDVSKLSTSLREMVDLAFRIVFCKYMGYIEIPLYLDEFASSFDNTHMIEAYRVIDNLIAREYPQIFLVCHYESLYGSLSNCDFNVLNPTNIVIDKLENINNNLKIK